MLSSIISHTPFWVWLIFYYLLRTGYTALSDYSVKPERLILLPVLFLFLSMDSMSAEPVMIFLWLVAILLGLSVGYVFFSAQIKKCYLDSENQLYFSGSPNLLILMMASFFIHYVLAVMSSISSLPVWGLLSVFMSGLISGAFGYRAIQSFRYYRYLSSVSRRDTVFPDK
ncbi:hypothetical protein [Vibrio salinus]|uniref:hypothetical protein n=1 Tax=Vibrio salinus TaxID=2899784 RepID=UPI001E3F9A15|nr:hypothetical protein [Vibrio salinus]MCE0495188.1 hypothetical protein [Vibrio salinus]